MEKKNDQKVISDREFMILLKAAKQNEDQAILQLIDLYKDDIMRISQYIYMPQRGCHINDCPGVYGSDSREQ